MQTRALSSAADDEEEKGPENAAADERQQKHAAAAVVAGADTDVVEVDAAVGVVGAAVTAILTVFVAYNAGTDLES